MRVELIGAVAVSDGSRAVRGADVGGRRARIVLTALALSGETLPADRLAATVWGDHLPPTWPAALRGVVRSLRTALAPLDGGGQSVIETVPSGYRLAAGVEVDTRAAADDLRRAQAHAAAGRPQAAIRAARPVAALSGDQLVPGEDAAWLATHRGALDELALQAVEVVALAAAAPDEQREAVDLARRAVATHPLDERAHRVLIGALERLGDRSGAARAYEQCRATLAEELGVDPSPDTVAAYLHAIQVDDAALPARVPVTPSSFVGRDEELSRLIAALERPGVVSVVGRGGVGKSRLAQQAAVAAERPGGSRWVSLASVAADELVATSVLLHLGMDAGAVDPVGELARRFAPIGKALLVLDGCEAVLDGAGSLATALRAGCPLLTVLITSRVPLGIADESVQRIEPLPAPVGDDPAQLAANAQVQILLDRVRADGSDVHLDGSAAPLVALLCRRCGGLPLALELAAAQLTAMPVGDLLDQLEQAEQADRTEQAGEPVSIGAPGDELRAVARSSYEQLGADEAAVFRRLGVLDGPTGLPMVRAVVAGADVKPVRVVRILRELDARGLITVDRSGPYWRYQQDDDLHRFARELLVAEGSELVIFDRLAAAVRGLLPEDATLPPTAFADQITGVLASIRSLFGAALDGSADVESCLELAFRLHRYWATTTVAEGRFWLSRLLASPLDSIWRRYATFALGYLAYWAGDTDDALRDLQAAVAMFGDTPDPFLARAYMYVAGLLDDLDRSAEALDYVGRAMAAAEPFGTDLFVATAMGVASVLSERGDPEAIGHAAAAVARCRVDGSADQLGVLLPTAAMVCWQVGAVAQAHAYVDEARPMHTGRKRIARVVLLSTSAGLAFGDGDITAAVEYGARADTEATELGVEREIPLIRSVLARALLAQDDLLGAADRALAAVDAAAEMGVDFPLAICLETAALVGAAAGAPEQRLAAMLAAAAGLRSAGDRPSPPTLRADVERLRARVGAAPVPADPAGLARLVLRAVVATDEQADATRMPG